VALGLARQSVGRAHQEQAKVGSRCAGCHIPGVLFVPGCIRDDELASDGTEEPVGDVDGDLLLAFCRKAVQQEREIEFVSPGAMSAGVVIERVQLIREQQPRFKEQPADKGGFSMIDRTADDKAQLALAFLLNQKLISIEEGGLRMHVHQKYPSCFLRSMAAPPSWSMMRPRRSENRLSVVSRMTPESVVALLSIAPVSG
jgi:hypothetical protein